MVKVRLRVSLWLWEDKGVDVCSGLGRPRERTICRASNPLLVLTKTNSKGAEILAREVTCLVKRHNIGP